MLLTNGVQAPMLIRSDQFSVLPHLIGSPENRELHVSNLSAHPHPPGQLKAGGKGLLTLQALLV